MKLTARNIRILATAEALFAAALSLLFLWANNHQTLTYVVGDLAEAILVFMMVFMANISVGTLYLDFRPQPAPRRRHPSAEFSYNKEDYNR